MTGIDLQIPIFPNNYKSYVLISYLMRSLKLKQFVNVCVGVVVYALGWHWPSRQICYSLCTSHFIFQQLKQIPTWFNKYPKFVHLWWCPFLIYESIILLHHHTKTCKFQTYLDTQPTKTVDIYIHIHVYLQQLKWSSYRHEPQTILNICEKFNGFMNGWYICTLACLSDVNSIILSQIAAVMVDISLKYISKLIFGLKIFSMLILSLNKYIFVDFSIG